MTTVADTYLVDRPVLMAYTIRMSTIESVLGVSQRWEEMMQYRAARRTA